MKTKSFPYRTAFVINSYAGKGRGLKTWKKVESYMIEKGISYEVFYTSNDAGDAAKTAARASEKGAELIVGLGGDGTLNEVVNGIDLDRNILGVLPGGTANGFRRSVKVPHNPILSLQGLFHWPVMKMDLGKVNDSYFLNSVGMGFDAQVSLTATDDRYWLKGYPGYVSACLQYMNYPPKVISYQLDNGEVVSKEAFLAVVANGRFYGGQLCIAPQACIDDGLLDFEIAYPGNNVRKVSMALMAFARNHTFMKGFDTARAKKVIINSEDDSMPVQVDGETKNMKRFPLEFTIFPKALKIVSPYNLQFPFKYVEPEARDKVLQFFNNS